MRKVSRLIFATLCMLLLVSCSFSAKAVSTPDPTEPPPAQKEAATEVTEIITENPIQTEAPTATVEVVTTDSPPPVVEIVHTIHPTDPVYQRDQRISDCNTGERILLGASTLIGSGCDNWNKAKFERPADQQNGTFYPALDIVAASMGADANWIYVKIELFEGAAGNINEGLVYGIEIDTDLDSRGDILILASGLSANGWTTNGIQVWQDQNGDVGGQKPHVPDSLPSDGYETLIFDAGTGADADLVWARIEPLDASNIEVAFKTSLVPGNKLFAWWVWSSMMGIEPSKVEFVDSLSESSLWMTDNTCGWIFNGKPTNILANICEFVMPTATPAPTAQPQSGEGIVCPPGEVWGWYPWGGKYMCYDPDPM